MGKLIYGINTSLDGYISDAQGGLDWGEPQEDLHRYINELERNNSLNGSVNVFSHICWDALI